MTGAMISNHFYPNSRAAESFGGILTEKKVTSWLKFFGAGFKALQEKRGNSQLCIHILAPGAQ